MRRNPPSRRETRLQRRGAALGSLGEAAALSPRDRARLERCARRKGRRIVFNSHGAWLERPGRGGRRLLRAEEAAVLLAEVGRWEAWWQGRRRAWRAWRRAASSGEPGPGPGHFHDGNPSNLGGPS